MKPPSHDSLLNAAQIQRHAIYKGFDFKSLDDVIEKLQEETSELKDAYQSGIDSDIADELGDVIFTSILLATYLKKDAQQCLSNACEKFERRFMAMERHLASNDIAIENASLEQMLSSWQKIKQYG